MNPLFRARVVVLVATPAVIALLTAAASQAAQVVATNNQAAQSATADVGQVAPPESFRVVRKQVVLNRQTDAEAVRAAGQAGAAAVRGALTEAPVNIRSAVQAGATFHEALAAEVDAVSQTVADSRNAVHTAVQGVSARRAAVREALPSAVEEGKETVSTAVDEAQTTLSEARGQARADITNAVTDGDPETDAREVIPEARADVRVAKKEAGTKVKGAVDDAKAGLVQALESQPESGSDTSSADSSERADRRAGTRGSDTT
jgi:uncharacterized protein YicC (UPF0701 family)